MIGLYLKNYTGWVEELVGMRAIMENYAEIRFTHHLFLILICREELIDLFSRLLKVVW
jgi:hypothetical protein